MVNIVMAGLLAAIIVLFLGIGLYHSRQIQTSDDFNVAGRKMGVWLVAGSVVATYMSTSTYIGFTGLFYSTGLGTFGIAFAAGLALIVAAMWIIGPIRHLRSVTIPDFLGQRYDNDLARALGALLVFAVTIGVATAAAQGFGLIVSGLTGLPYEASLVIAMSAAIMYTMLGGLFSVFWTDSLSLLVMLVVIAFGVPFLFFQAGDGSILTGWELVYTGLPEGWLSWQGVGGAFGGSLLVGQFILWTFGGAILPYVFTRGLSADSEKTAVQGFSIGFVLYTVVAVIPFSMAMAVTRVARPNLENPDNAFIVMAQELLPPIVGELVLLTVLLAGISSVDSQLIVSAQSYAVDVYEGMIDPDASAERNILVSRVTTFVAGITIIALAWFQLDGIFWVASFAVQIAAAGLFVPIVGGIYWRKGTWQGASACIVGGPLTIIAIDLLNVDLSWMGLFSHLVVPGMIVGTVLYIAVSLATVSSITDESLEVYREVQAD